MSEDGYSRQVERATHAAVAWMYGPAQLVLLSLGLYPSDRMLPASFADALKDAFEREPAR